MNPEEAQQHSESVEKKEEKRPPRGTEGEYDWHRPYRHVKRLPVPEEYPYRRYERMPPPHFRYPRAPYPPMYDRPPRGYPHYRMEPPRYPYLGREYRDERMDSWPEPPYHHLPYNRRRPRPGPDRRGMGPQTPARVLGLFGLDISVTEGELAQWLGEMLGHELEVEKIHLIVNKTTRLSRGFAFVYFHTVEDATKAKEQLTDKKCKEQPIRVEYSFTSAGHPQKEAGREEEENASR